MTYTGVNKWLNKLINGGEEANSPCRRILNILNPARWAWAVHTDSLLNAAGWVEEEGGDLARRDLANSTSAGRRRSTLAAIRQVGRMNSDTTWWKWPFMLRSSPQKPINATYETSHETNSTRRNIPSCSNPPSSELSGRQKQGGLRNCLSQEEAQETATKCLPRPGWRPGTEQGLSGEKLGKSEKKICTIVKNCVNSGLLIVTNMPC